MCTSIVFVQSCKSYLQILELNKQKYNDTNRYGIANCFWRGAEDYSRDALSYTTRNVAIDYSMHNISSGRQASGWHSWWWHSRWHSGWPQRICVLKLPIFSWSSLEPITLLPLRQFFPWDRVDLESNAIHVKRKRWMVDPNGCTSTSYTYPQKTTLGAVSESGLQFLNLSFDVSSAILCHQNPPKQKRDSNEFGITHIDCWTESLLPNQASNQFLFWGLPEHRK